MFGQLAALKIDQMSASYMDFLLSAAVLILFAGVAIAIAMATIFLVANFFGYFDDQQQKPTSESKVLPH